jgi:hypothetical protein
MGQDLITVHVFTEYTLRVLIYNAVILMYANVLILCNLMTCVLQLSLEQSEV